MIFLIFPQKPYVVTPHLNCLIETVLMRIHNICFYAEMIKIIHYYPKYTLLSRALDVLCNKTLLLIMSCNCLHFFASKVIIISKNVVKILQGVR